MPAPQDHTLETLAEIEATATLICQGVELFDPDAIGDDILRQVAQLSELMHELDDSEESGLPAT